MANKNTKRYLKSLITREMQIQITIPLHPLGCKNNKCWCECGDSLANVVWKITEWKQNLLYY